MPISLSKSGWQFLCTRNGRGPLADHAVNRKYPLATLIDACRYYHTRKKQKLTFEYILIANVNDTEDQAFALAQLAAELEAKVNLIPL